jgi:hypothetical protein
VTRKHSVEIICGARFGRQEREGGPRSSIRTRSFGGDEQCASEHRPARDGVRLKQRLDILLQEAHAAPAEAQRVRTGRGR